MRPCPHCKREIRAFWDDCPFCFTTLRWAQRVDGKNIPREAFQAWVAAGRPQGNTDYLRRDLTRMGRYEGPTHYPGTVDAPTPKRTTRKERTSEDISKEDLLRTAGALIDRISV